MYIKERLYALFRYFCVKILHKQNFIISTIVSRVLSRLFKKITEDKIKETRGTMKKAPKNDLSA